MSKALYSARASKRADYRNSWIMLEGHAGAGFVSGIRKPKLNSTEQCQQMNLR